MLVASSASAVGDGKQNAGFVRLYVYEAANLMAKDSNGLSDPYLVVVDTLDVDGKECKTKVLKKTVSPKWNESFTFPVANLDRWAVRLQLYDWDMLGKDSLGFVDVVANVQKVCLFVVIFLFLINP